MQTTQSLKSNGARAKTDPRRQEMLDKLQNAERHFRLLFENSPNAIVLFDPDTWKPVEFNHQAAEFMGYSPEEFRELEITDLEMVPNPDETRRHIEEIHKTGYDIFEAFHKKKNGDPVHVVVSLRLTEWYGRPVMLTIWHDITDRKLAEQALRDSENRLASILQTAMDAIIIIDDRHRIERCNPATAKVFRCALEEMRGEPIGRFMPDNLVTKALQFPRKNNGADSGSNQLWAPDGLFAKRADGDVFPVELTVSPMTIGEQRFFTLILRDVNERQAARAELAKLRLENSRLQQQLQVQNKNKIIFAATSPMRRTLAQVDQVAVTDATVLLVGETGTGKELLARAIHDRSHRKQNALVSVNCAALPKTLIESELFGHERGAFTGATQRKKGRFELADGGTIFLDEVGELSLEAQSKLLRVLQEHELERVGGEKTIRIDVRVIAATNRDLEQMTGTGEFRQDLYYRLSVFPLRVPPLRERKPDIPILIDQFVREFSHKLGKPLSGFDEPDIERALNYTWPGNIRELRNVVERAAILTSNATLKLGDWFNAAGSGRINGHHQTMLQDVVRDHLVKVLEESGWTIEGENGAAARLGLNPSTLRFKMKKLGIHREQMTKQ